jgi:tetratricopeptide (TPR) repeat protein
MTSNLDLNLQSFEESQRIWPLLEQFDKTAGRRDDVVARAVSLHALMPPPNCDPITGVISNILHVFDMLELGIIARALPATLPPTLSEKVLSFFSHPLVTAYRWANSHIISDRLFLRAMEIGKEIQSEALIQEYFSVWALNASFFGNDDASFFLQAARHEDAGLLYARETFGSIDVFCELLRSNSDEPAAGRYVRGFLKFLHFSLEMNSVCSRRYKQSDFQSACWWSWASLFEGSSTIECQVNLFLDMITSAEGKDAELISFLLYDFSAEHVRQSMADLFHNSSARTFQMRLMRRLLKKAATRHFALKAHDLHKAALYAVALTPALRFSGHDRRNAHLTRLRDLENELAAQAEDPMLTASVGIDAATESHRLNGPRAPLTAQLLGNLGTTLHTLGRDDLAKDAHEQALLVLGENPRHRAVIFSNIARTLAASNLDEALMYDQRVSDIITRHPDLFSPLLKGSMFSSMGELLRRKGNISAAEDKLKKAMFLGRNLHHPKVAIWINNMAALLVDMGELEQAENLFDKAIEILIKHRFAEDNTYVVAIRANAVAARSGRRSDIVGYQDDLRLVA